mgnify:CR=1 FL=1
MRSKKPVAERDLKTYPVDVYPYLVTKPHERAVGGPWHYRSHKAAVQSLVKELSELQQQFKRLNSTDAVSRIGQLMDDVSALPLEGGRVVGVVDTVTGVRYQAELVKREGIQ